MEVYKDYRTCQLEKAMELGELCFWWLRWLNQLPRLEIIWALELLSGNTLSWLRGISPDVWVRTALWESSGNSLFHPSSLTSNSSP